MLLKFLDLPCLDFVGLESVEVKFSRICLFYFLLCDALHGAPLDFNKAPNLCKDGGWRDLLPLHQSSGCVFRNNKTLLVKALSPQKGLIT